MPEGRWTKQIHHVFSIPQTLSLRCFSFLSSSLVSRLFSIEYLFNWENLKKMYRHLREIFENCWGSLKNFRAFWVQLRKETTTTNANNAMSQSKIISLKSELNLTRPDYETQISALGRSSLANIKLMYYCIRACICHNLRLWKTLSRMPHIGMFYCRYRCCYSCLQRSNVV